MASFALLSPDVAWWLIAGVIFILVLATLRTIGAEYLSAVLWHNLKIEVDKLRLEQKRRIDALVEAESNVDIVDESAGASGAAPGAPMEATIVDDPAGQPEAPARAA